MAMSFDEAELLERIDNDLTFLAETVQMLADEGRVLMMQVGQAAAAGDASALVRAAHALKGMISNFCAPSVYRLALELEHMGRDGDLSAAAPLVDRLRVRLESLIAELLAFIQAKSR